MTLAVAPHGSLALKLTQTVLAPAPSFTFYPAASSSAILAGGASTRVVNSTATVVGFVGNGGTLTFTNVNGGSSGGNKLLSIDYIDADVAFNNNACSNCRNAFVSVNGGPSIQIQFPISGQVRKFRVFFLFPNLNSIILHRAGISYIPAIL